MGHFDREYAPRLAIRANSFRRIMQEAVRRDVLTIVETGSLREPENWEGDGQSTVIFDAFASIEGAKFTSIDIDPKAIENAKNLCPKTIAICANSIPTLQAMNEPIDLLYLDANNENDSLHCLFEYITAKHLLHKGSIVCADDSPRDAMWNVHGKGQLLDQYFRELDLKPFTLGYQVAWVIR